MRNPRTMRMWVLGVPHRDAPAVFVARGRQLRIIIPFLLLCSTVASPPAAAQPQFEFQNNWLQWVSFVTRGDRGIARNLEDNLGWMQAQGYTHLRFFGIYPNGLHAFSSPTLDANGFPTDPEFESVLPILVSKAQQHGISINFDGWEVIAESNQDTTGLGVSYMTEGEVAAVVQEVLDHGVERITEEQFGVTYLRAIQAKTAAAGALHETTAGTWWSVPGIADEQICDVFTFYPIDQGEADSLLMSGSSSATIGVTHIFAEGAHHFGIPVSVAVGSFGLYEAENWRNALLFVQLQHLPERLSVEETDTDFTIWNPGFNFMTYVGNEVVSLASEAIGPRPIANLVLDSGVIPPSNTSPVSGTFLVNAPAVANTFTLLGYKVVTTVDSVLPGAAAYVALLSGGANAINVAPLPAYVMPLLNGTAPVVLQPAYGIPDANDAASWLLLRSFFGLPGGDTQTYTYAIPATVSFQGAQVRWAAAPTTLAPILEWIPRAQVDTTQTAVRVSTSLLGQQIALLVQRGNKSLINSNIVHLEASYILSRLLGGPLRAPITADVMVTEDRALIYAEYGGTIDLDLPWQGATRVRRYDPEGSGTQDEVVSLAGRYTADLARGEFVFLVSAVTTAVGGEPRAGLPSAPLSLVAHPNPLTLGTTLRFVLPGRALVAIEIFSVTGRRIRSVFSGPKEAGLHEISWDGRDDRGVAVPSGIYFCRVVAGGGARATRIVVLR